MKWLEYMPKLSEKGVAHLLLLLVLFGGLIAGVYLIGQQTNIFPKAYSPKKTLSQPLPSCKPRPACLDTRPACKLPEPVDGWCKTGYYLEPMPMEGVVMVAPSDPNSGYGVYALLKKTKASGEVVKDQKNYQYTWTVEKFDPTLVINVEPFAACTNGIQPPCPLDHATITVSKLGSTSSANLWVKVTDITTNKEVAKVEFSLNFVPKDKYVYFNKVRPGYTQGEIYNVGQTIPISWEMVGKGVSYYNLGYWYYYNGEKTYGFIGTVYYPATSYQWKVPTELTNLYVRIWIDPRNEHPGDPNQPGAGYSNWAFKIVNPQ